MYSYMSSLKFKTLTNLTKKNKVSYSIKFKLKTIFIEFFYVQFQFSYHLEQFYQLHTKACF